MQTTIPWKSIRYYFELYETVRIYDLDHPLMDKLAPSQTYSATFGISRCTSMAIYQTLYGSISRVELNSCSVDIGITFVSYVSCQLRCSLTTNAANSLIGGDNPGHIRVRLLELESRGSACHQMVRSTGSDPTPSFQLHDEVRLECCSYHELATQWLKITNKMYS